MRQPAGGLIQEPVARKAGRGFNAIARLGRQTIHGDVFYLARHAEPVAEFDDELLVVLGVGAQLVVQMGRADAARAAGFQGHHRPQQRHAVTAA